MSFFFRAPLLALSLLQPPSNHGASHFRARSPHACNAPSMPSGWRAGRCISRRRPGFTSAFFSLSSHFTGRLQARPGVAGSEVLEQHPQAGPGARGGKTRVPHTRACHTRECERGARAGVARASVGFAQLLCLAFSSASPLSPLNRKRRRPARPSAPSSSASSASSCWGRVSLFLDARTKRRGKERRSEP